ncbi:MAG: hypothetical protein J6B92_05110 [Paraprevotella sp.]|nr:hypothetical protein [Paraprevotella sp.]
MVTICLVVMYSPVMALSPIVMPGYGVNALKGHQAHSPGQSVATPWVSMESNTLRPERAKA